MTEEGALAKFGTAVEFRDIIKNIVRKVISEERPAGRYATVDSVDLVLRKAQVHYVNDAGSLRVSIGSFIPLVGQKVRIAGTAGDKYVDDIIGDVTIPELVSVPNPVTALDFTSSIYQDQAQGYTSATLTVTWTDPATDTDGEPLDLTKVSYILQWQINTSSLWNNGGTVNNANTGMIPGVPTNTSVRVRVQAVIGNGSGSAWTTSGYHTTQKDSGALNSPSIPQVTAVVAGLKVKWDGKDNVGGNMPANFDRVEVYYGTTNVFASATLWDVIKSYNGGTVTITNLAYGTPYYVFLKAYNQSAVGSGSTISNTTTQILHVDGSVGGDITNLQADVITGGTIGATFIRVSGRLTTSVGGVQSGARTELDGSGLRIYDSTSTGFSSGQLLVADSSGLNVYGGKITGTQYLTAAGMASGAGIPGIQLIGTTTDSIYFYTSNTLETGQGVIWTTHNATYARMLFITPEISSSGPSQIEMRGAKTDHTTPGQIYLQPQRAITSGAQGIVRAEGVLNVTGSGGLVDYAADYQYNGASMPRGVVFVWRANQAPSNVATTSESSFYDNTQITTFLINSQQAGRRYRIRIKGIISGSAVAAGSQHSIRLRANSFTGTLLINAIVSAASTGLQTFFGETEVVVGTDILAANTTFFLNGIAANSNNLTLTYAAGQLYSNFLLTIEDIGD